MVWHHKADGIIGVNVSAVDIGHAISLISEWVKSDGGHYICVTAAHSLMACRRDPELRRIFNQAGMVTPDGMPLVWLLRLKGHKHVRRVYGPELMDSAIERLEAKHFLYGGTPELLDELVEKIQNIHPVARIVGRYAPPFRPLTEAEDREVIAAIKQSEADIVWVGLGTGKQERWMAEHVGKVGAPVLIGVGAAFDFLAGRKPQAPKWIRQSGFEWLFRLISEPRRLWPRYRQYPKFVWLVLLQLLGLKSFPIDDRYESEQERLP